MNHVIYQTQKAVLDHISKHWEETLVEYIFWWTLFGNVARHSPESLRYPAGTFYAELFLAE